MRLPLAIGAVVLGAPSTFQTPLSGQISPVRALVPIGTRFAAVIFMSLPFAFAGRPVEVRYNWSDGRWPSVNLLHSLDGRDHDRPLTTRCTQFIAKLPDRTWQRLKDSIGTPLRSSADSVPKPRSEFGHQLFY